MDVSLKQALRNQTTLTARADVTSVASTERPLVSVIVPTYGRPEYLQASLRSIGAQTYEPVELMIVDDHSASPVEPLVTDCSLDVSKIQCLRHEENRGAAAARNTGIAAADGEFVAFLDDDDTWEPQYLERVVTAFDDPAVGLVSVSSRIVDGDGNHLGVQRAESTDDPLADLLDGTQAGSFSRFAVRASLIDVVGSLDERLPSWQDWEWQFRFAQHCQFASVPTPLVTHRIGDHDQLTDDFEARREVSYRVMLERHCEPIARRGRRDERRFRAVLLRSLAASALRNGAYLSAISCLLRAIRYDPTATEVYPYLLAALGGQYTHRPLQRLRRYLVECTR